MFMKFIYIVVIYLSFSIALHAHKCFMDIYLVFTLKNLLSINNIYLMLINKHFYRKYINYSNKRIQKKNTNVSMA